MNRVRAAYRAVRYPHTLDLMLVSLSGTPGDTDILNDFLHMQRRRRGQFRNHIAYRHIDHHPIEPMPSGEIPNHQLSGLTELSANPSNPVPNLK